MVSVENFENDVLIVELAFERNINTENKEQGNSHLSILRIDSIIL